MARVELRQAVPVTCWLLLLFSAFGSVRPAPQVPCYFIFGDSLVDNGNNNNMASLAVANYPPYGIDFPGGPSGRFSNGLTTVDAIGVPIPAMTTMPSHFFLLANNQSYNLPTCSVCHTDRFLFAQMAI